jgi:hypothetical protein
MNRSGRGGSEILVGVIKNKSESMNEKRRNSYTSNKSNREN